MTTKKYDYISIYKWEEAPQIWKDLSTNGGDEDWLAFVPESMANDYILFLEENHFGNIVDRYYTAGGVVIISAHA